MGLDIIIENKKGEELDSFRAGSYSGFKEFREILADSVGINLNEMIGFDGKKEWEKDMPFIDLLNHSDCDGKIGVIACKNLLEDFKEYFDKKIDKREQILIKLEHGEYAEWFTEMMAEWKKALELAVENKGRLIFC